MMGTFTSSEGLALITEYMENGSLANFYLSNPAMSWEVKLRCALTTCRGLAWLHSLSPPILHRYAIHSSSFFPNYNPACRDLHSKNILVSGNGDCKISDFGLSQLQGSTQEKHTIYQRIIPPEIRTDVANYSKASGTLTY